MLYGVFLPSETVNAKRSEAESVCRLRGYRAAHQYALALSPWSPPRLHLIGLEKRVRELQQKHNLIALAQRLSSEDMSLDEIAQHMRLSRAKILKWIRLPRLQPLLD